VVDDLSPFLFLGRVHTRCCWCFADGQLPSFDALLSLRSIRSTGCRILNDQPNPSALTKRRVERPDRSGSCVGACGRSKQKASTDHRRDFDQVYWFCWLWTCSWRPTHSFLFSSFHTSKRTPRISFSTNRDSHVRTGSSLSVRTISRLYLQSSIILRTEEHWTYMTRSTSKEVGWTTCGRLVISTFPFFVGSARFATWIAQPQRQTRVLMKTRKTVQRGCRT
jgi:hypothetical protein